ncbi:Ribosomal protein L22e containing protein [Cricetulus griseus]|uniref:Ribosomal protein L22e containing protein n=1 Tax=Cricetulus griseus TaxID=10029 RepID=A0A061IFP8_CRIGR|nr:Ribosomal protein L22e containing protein [Cricetulus griseus]
MSGLIGMELIDTDPDMSNWLTGCVDSGPKVVQNNMGHAAEAARPVTHRKQTSTVLAYSQVPFVGLWDMYGMAPVPQEMTMQVLCRFQKSGNGENQDGIMDTDNFEQFLQERIKVNRKAGNLGGGVVTIEQSKSKITVTSEVAFPKRLQILRCLNKVQSDAFLLGEMLSPMQQFSTYGLGVGHNPESPCYSKHNEKDYKSIGSYLCGHVPLIEHMKLAFIVHFNEFLASGVEEGDIQLHLHTDNCLGAIPIVG